MDNWRSFGRYLCLVAAPDVRIFPTLNAERFYSEEKGRFLLANFSRGESSSSHEYFSNLCDHATV